MSINRRRLVVLLFVAVCTLFATLYFFQVRNKAPSAKLTFGILGTALIDGLSIVAAEQDPWKDNGLTVDVRRFSSGRETAEALIGGHVDVATFAELPFVLASVRDPSLRIIRVLNDARSLGIVVNRTKKIDHPVDLKGRSIGVSVGTTGNLALISYLQKNGITSKDIRVINLGPAELLAAFINGDVDAICTWQPFVQFALQRSPDGALLSGSQDHLRAMYLLVAREKTILDRREELSRLVAGLDVTQVGFEQRASDAQLILGKATGLDLASLRNIWDLFEFKVRSADVALTALRDAEKFAAASGMLAAGTPLRDWSKHTANLK